MKIRRRLKIDCPLSGELVTQGERVVDVEEALMGFTNAIHARTQLAQGLHQHGVCLIADLRVCVELIPIKDQPLPLLSGGKS